MIRLLPARQLRKVTILLADGTPITLKVLELISYVAMQIFLAEPNELLLFTKLLLESGKMPNSLLKSDQGAFEFKALKVTCLPWMQLYNIIS